jgi:Mg2+ and Co2+ transporter CorA
MGFYTFKIIDETGKSEEIILDKKQLFEKYKTIVERDLHIIDEALNFRISSCAIKDNIIMIKLDHIRIIIEPKRVLFSTDTTVRNKNPPQNFFDKLVSVLQENKEQKNNEIPFEIKILEEILIYISNIYDNQLNDLKPLVAEIMNPVNNNIHNSTVETKIMIARTQLVELEYKIKDIYDLLKYFSKWNKEDYLDFYLDKKIPQDKQEVMCDKVEDMINTYLKYFEEDVEDLQKMDTGIETLLKITNIRIFKTHNKLTKLTLLLTLIMMVISIGNLITSIYGMNVPNYIETTYSAFPIIIFIILSMIFGIYLYGMKYIDEQINI